MKRFVLPFFTGILATFGAHAQHVTTVAGNGFNAQDLMGLDAVQKSFNSPCDIAFDKKGTMYIADWYNAVIKKMEPGKPVTIFAGTGVPGYSGDEGPATSAQINYPASIAVDTNGNVYVADVYNNRVRKIDTFGIMHTFAGNGTVHYEGDGEIAFMASLHYPCGLATDKKGNVYIADKYNHAIRKVTADGNMYTVIGEAVPVAMEKQILLKEEIKYEPVRLAVNDSGEVFFSTEDNKIQKVTSKGNVVTIAGTGKAGYYGNGGAATTAQLNHPTAICLDGGNNLYFSDLGNNCIRMVTKDGTIRTIAGNTHDGFYGDGGPATDAELNNPNGVAIGNGGSLYFVDGGNQRVRKLYTPAKPTPKKQPEVVASTKIGRFTINLETNPDAHYTAPAFNNLGGANTVPAAPASTYHIGGSSGGGVSAPKPTVNKGKAN